MIDAVRELALGGLGALLFCAYGLRAAAAEPYVPATDTAVLATVTPAEGLGHARVELLRAALQRDPADAAVATQLANIYADINASSGEPRYLGYALGVLEPWRDDASPPQSVWLIRARVAQRLHRFADAQVELEHLLQDHPDDSEAALLLSTVGVVRGDYVAARSGCAHLAAQRHLILGTICRANLSPYGGDAAAAARALEALVHSGALAGSLETWVLTLAAELAVGSGAAAEAEGYYKQALASVHGGAGPDLYLLGSYADFLTDEGRGEAALALLAPAPPTDPMLIRRALAASDGPLRRQAVELLRSRMTALVRRDPGDAHARELAWAHLHVFGDAEAGLRYAQRNWQQQRELRDARLLLEAAVAANDRSAAQPVVEWAEANGVRHAWLDELVGSKLQASGP